MSKTLYEIHEIPYFQFLMRLISLGWIYFAYLKYVLNPMFFLVTIIIAFGIILILPTHVYEATEEGLVVKTRFWLPFFNKRKLWEYEDLIEFRYDKANSFLVFFSWIVPESSKLVVRVKGRRSKYLSAI